MASATPSAKEDKQFLISMATEFLYEHDLLNHIFEEKNIENQLQIDMGDDFKSLFYTVENYNQNETRILWFNGLWSNYGNPKIYF